MNAARAKLAVLAFVVTALLAAAPSAAQERIEFGPFYILSSEPDRLYLDGPMWEGAADSFLALVESHPEATTLVLNSANGTTVESMVIAEIAHARELDTFVPAGSRCVDACFPVFMAGMGRDVEGEVGFRFFSTDRTADHFFSTEERHGLELDQLIRFGATPDLLDVWTGLPWNDSRMLGPQDAIAMGLVRTRSLGLAMSIRAPAPSDFTNAELPQFAFVGEAVAGLITLAGHDGTAETMTTATWWQQSTDPSQPSVRAGMIVQSPELFVRLTFLHDTSGDDIVLVDVPTTESESSLHVSTVGPLGLWDFENPTLRRGTFTLSERQDMEVAGVGEVTRFVLRIPRIYAAEIRERYSDTDHDVMSLFLEFDDGSDGSIYIPFSPEGRAALLEAVQTWTAPEGP